tara:strand:- start:893 stop:1027 length:135 start_codon:yes stop_codon:yes gene_type:complete
MAFQKLLESIQSLIPEFIGAALIILALLGTRELLKETSIALKKV